MTGILSRSAAARSEPIVIGSAAPTMATMPRPLRVFQLEATRAESDPSSSEMTCTGWHCTPPRAFTACAQIARPWRVLPTVEPISPDVASVWPRMIGESILVQGCAPTALAATAGAPPAAGLVPPLVLLVVVDWPVVAAVPVPSEVPAAFVGVVPGSAAGAVRPVAPVAAASPVVPGACAATWALYPLPTASIRSSSTWVPQPASSASAAAIHAVPAVRCRERRRAAGDKFRFTADLQGRCCEGTRGEGSSAGPRERSLDCGPRQSGLTGASLAGWSRRALRVNDRLARQPLRDTALRRCRHEHRSEAEGQLQPLRRLRVIDVDRENVEQDRRHEGRDDGPSSGNGQHRKNNQGLHEIEGVLGHGAEERGVERAADTGQEAGDAEHDDAGDVDGGAQC